ncbi:MULTISPECIES: lysozyme [Streptomyces]|uniref:Lysozyme n=1 Tax=Streptomyces celluloflavus TaxID=58344 RepID=A0ABW7RQ14_9ACTN|nr:MULTISPECIES: lysozyme [Streptomyces]MYU50534.1 lysozyme [Streptomyces sp. SID7805]WSK17008.1 lysozyme [Streptomyces celluloflavus]
MPLRRSGPARRTLPLAAGTLASLFSVLVLPLALPGTAGAADTRKVPAHPEQDWMGSTIAAHEGGQRATGSEPRTTSANVSGVDVSSHNGDVDWPAMRESGVRFAYVKATEGTGYKNPYFTQQYKGAYDADMIHGAYHFALPDHSSGAEQATYFAHHGGGWTKDGKTLPGALDMEYNPYGDTCYGKSASAMVSWIAEFFRTYREKTGRDAIIYTSANWWKQCTEESGKFGKTNPLWVPRYGTSVGTLPAGWKYHTIWQYTSTGQTVGDRNRFNGAYSRLKALANG